MSKTFNQPQIFIFQIHVFELFPPANDNLIKFFYSSLAAPDVVNRGKKNLVGGQTVGDEEKREKKMEKKGSKKGRLREEGGWGLLTRATRCAASGKRVSCDRHIFRADALTLALPLRSSRVRCTPQATIHPVHALAPPILLPFVPTPSRAPFAHLRVTTPGLWK